MASDELRLDLSKAKNCCKTQCRTSCLVWNK